MHDSFEELFSRIEANTGLIFIDTFEEGRLIREIKSRFPGNTVQFWSATQGLHSIAKSTEPKKVKPHMFEPDQAKKTKKNQPSVGNILNALEIIEDECRTKIDQRMNNIDSTVYILRDADKFFNNPMPIRKLRDILYLASTAGSPIIITGAGMKVPDELCKDSAYIELGLPTRSEIISNIIEKRVLSLIRLYNNTVEDGQNDGELIESDFDMDLIANACMGLTEEEIINTCSYSIEVKHKLCADVILQEKKNIINKNDILTFWPCDGGLNTIGGFNEFKAWFKVQKTTLDNPESAEAFCAEPPKGCMILGVQGSGKTAAAKAAAKEWGKGVIKLDMGNVFAGLVGESEKRMRMALAQAEAAGGIVIIDELDKGLAGAGSSDKTDGGTTKRVIGTLLTWMQESHPGVFVVATANDITSIRNAHPELLRKGRFDNIFFSDVPTEEERKAILDIHLTKRKRDPKKFKTDEIAKLQYKDSSGQEYSWVGAEYEHAIKEAIQYKLSDALNSGKTVKIGGKTDITSADVINHLNGIIPIVKVGEKTIRKMRDWSKDNATNVSTIRKTIIEKELAENKTSTKKRKINLNADDIM